MKTKVQNFFLGGGGMRVGGEAGGGGGWLFPTFVNVNRVKYYKFLY